jgi:hypothetical protein
VDKARNTVRHHAEKLPARVLPTPSSSARPTAPNFLKCSYVLVYRSSFTDEFTVIFSRGFLICMLCFLCGCVCTEPDPFPAYHNPGAEFSFTVTEVDAFGEYPSPLSGAVVSIFVNVRSP